MFAQQHENRLWTTGLVLGPQADCRGRSDPQSEVINSPADLSVLEKDPQKQTWLHVSSPKVWVSNFLWS